MPSVWVCGDLLLRLMDSCVLQASVISGTRSGLALFSSEGRRRSRPSHVFVRNLVTTPDTELVIELVQMLQERVMSCTTTFIVKVNAHRDETQNEDPNTRPERDRVPAGAGECGQRGGKHKSQVLWNTTRTEQYSYIWKGKKSPKRRSGVMGDSQNHTYGRGGKKGEKNIWCLVPWTEKTMRSLISFDVSMS